MKCRQVQFYLTDYLSGNLSLNDTRDFEEHLAACATCRLLVQEERELVTILRGLPTPDPGGSYWSGLEQTILEKARIRAAGDVYPAASPLRKRREFPWRLAIPLAASLALFFLSLEDNRYPERMLGTGFPSTASTSQPTRSGEIIETDFQVEYTLLLSAPGLAPRNLLMVEIINQTESEGSL